MANDLFIINNIEQNAPRIVIFLSRQTLNVSCVYAMEGNYDRIRWAERIPAATLRIGIPDHVGTGSFQYCP